MSFSKFIDWRALDNLNKTIYICELINLSRWTNQQFLLDENRLLHRFVCAQSYQTED